MLTFSVIMQSYNPDVEKLHRAINSVLGQQCKCFFELIVIADNCEKTYNSVSENYLEEFNSPRPRIRLFHISNDHKLKKIYSKGRNYGISVASGQWILYLDNDDYFTNDYLEQLSKLINGALDWFVVDDLVYKDGWNIRRCNLRSGQCGTANIVHKSTMLSRWPDVASYGKDDWIFINNLKHESNKFRQLNVAGYCVCHIPNRYSI
jgi:glycosyltransferase involved in cell wall biosynthesis